MIIWHLLADPTTHYRDLGPDFHTTHINTDRKIRNLVHQLEALGHTVTLQTRRLTTPNPIAPPRPGDPSRPKP